MFSEDHKRLLKEYGLQAIALDKWFEDNDFVNIIYGYFPNKQAFDNNKDYIESILMETTLSQHDFLIIQKTGGLKVKNDNRYYIEPAPETVNNKKNQTEEEKAMMNERTQIKRKITRLSTNLGNIVYGCIRVVPSEKSPKKKSSNKSIKSVSTAEETLSTADETDSDIPIAEEPSITEEHDICSVSTLPITGDNDNTNKSSVNSLVKMFAGRNKLLSENPNPDDLFETDPEVVKVLLNCLNIPIGKVIFEPCAGNGAICNVLRYFCIY